MCSIVRFFWRKERCSVSGSDQLRSRSQKICTEPPDCTRQTDANCTRGRPAVAEDHRLASGDVTYESFMELSYTFDYGLTPECCGDEERLTVAGDTACIACRVNDTRSWPESRVRACIAARRRLTCQSASVDVQAPETCQHA